MQRAPIIYIPHGGGPLPLLGEPGHRDLVSHLQTLGKEIGTPRAILVISAHWEEAKATITGGERPPLIYDYYGFPPESYAIRYDAPGHPGLAERLRGVLDKASVEVAVDADRGFDHGVFVPLKLMYPEANVPCVQMSLVAGLSPERHVALGRALAELRDEENVLVVGSGMSFHNMRAFGGTSDESFRLASEFDQWLVETCTDETLDARAREERLLGWTEAPGARFAHPREEHLVPLHVCFGAGAPARARLMYRGELMGYPVSSFLWP